MYNFKNSDTLSKTQARTMVICEMLRYFRQHFNNPSEIKGKFLLLAGIYVTLKGKIKRFSEPDILRHFGVDLKNLITFDNSLKVFSKNEKLKITGSRPVNYLAEMGKGSKKWAKISSIYSRIAEDKICAVWADFCQGVVSEKANVTELFKRLRLENGPVFVAINFSLCPRSPQSITNPYKIIPYLMKKNKELKKDLANYDIEFYHSYKSEEARSSMAIFTFKKRK